MVDKIVEMGSVFHAYTTQIFFFFGQIEIKVGVDGVKAEEEHDKHENLLVLTRKSFW